MKRCRRWAALLPGLLGGLCSCAARAPAVPSSGRPTASSSSQQSENEQLSLTVYNQNFGLVREVRRVHVALGKVELSYRDVSAHIQPETVHLKSLSGASEVTVLEQNYRYDLLSPDTLLKKYLGKTIKVYRYNEHSGLDEAKWAQLLAVEAGPVLKIDGEITSNFSGRFAFPELPDDLLQQPTLVWLLSSTAPEQRLEVTYLTGGLDWHADYVLSVDAEQRRAELSGWITLQNETGTSYRDAQLKLVAGDVQRVTPPAPPRPTEARADVPAAVAPPKFNEQALFEYHLYTLERTTTLLDKEQKQVSLLSASGIALDKTLIFYGAAQYFRGNYGHVVSNQKVGLYLDLQNTEQNQLGMPLPKGIVRVYESDPSGQKQFIGEDAIDHTPRDERIRIKLGEAFDVVGDRTETSFQALSPCIAESAWEIKLRNHEPSAERVLIYEPAGGDWEILSSSLPATKRDASTFGFDVPLAPHSETNLTYRVRVRWC